MKISKDSSSMLVIMFLALSFFFAGTLKTEAAQIVGGSSLLSQADAVQLETWAGYPLTLTKVFSRSPGDGQTAQDFHNAVDGNGATFSIIRLTSPSTNVIGGYNAVSWNSKSAYGDGFGLGFLFNLTTGRMLNSNNVYATYNRSNYGPTFGNGHNLYVSNSLSSGHTYAYSSSYITADGKGLFGENNGTFKASSYGEIEVFTVDDHPDIPPSTVTTVVAGTGSAGFSGDTGDATAAKLSYPRCAVADASGNVFIADWNNKRIRRVDAATGNITTVVGNGSYGFSGDGGPATSAVITRPMDLALDSAGNLFFVDYYNHRIRRLDASTGNISTVAGNGLRSFSGDGSAATSASLNYPWGIAVDASGNLFIADRYNHRIRRVDVATGNISTVAGNGASGFSGDGSAATSARLSYPMGVDVDGSGNLYIADSNNRRIRRVDAGSGNISTVVGTDVITSTIYNLSLDSAGDIYFADTYGNKLITKVDKDTSELTQLLPDNYNQIYQVNVGADGNLYIANYWNHLITKIDAADLGASSNQAPVADAGFDQTKCPGSDVTLNGAGSSDPDGDTFTYSWTGPSPFGSLTGVNPTVSNVQTGDYTVSLVVDDGTDLSTADTVDISIEDTMPPVVVTQDISVDLDAAGSATIVAGDVNNGSSDNCGIDTLSVSPDSFNCGDVGSNSVMLTVTDNSENQNSATPTVTVRDIENPVISCPVDVTINTDAESPTAVYSYTYPTATDNCSASIARTSGFASWYAFPLGKTTNTFIATDGAGNTDTCSFAVTVNDNQAPKINCPQSMTICTDRDQSTSDFSFVPPTVTDNSNESLTAVLRVGCLTSGSAFPMGTTTNTYDTTDSSGNTSSCSFSVTVIDCQVPEIMCPEDITAFTDAGIHTAEVSYSPPTVTDNSGESLTAVLQAGGLTSRSKFPIGKTTNNFIATDAAGNEASCSFTVTVIDNENPVITCPSDISVNNDPGSCGAVVGFSSATATDNSSSVAVTQEAGLASGSVFPLGTSTVTYQAEDPSGNKAVCSFTVTVNDNELPDAQAQNLIVQLDSAGNASITAAQVNNNSSDNCGIASLNVAPSSFNCENVGANPITLTVTDTNGNVSTADAVVTVEDNVAPVALAHDMTAQLDGTGNVSINASQIDNGSNDACGIASLSVAPGAFSCASIGANSVTLTVIDKNGNQSTATAVVTVADSVPPVVLTQNMTIYLDAAGNASITAAQVNNGSNDNCGVASTSVTPYIFGCGNVGDNIVMLTVVDVNGNVNSGLATVTVVDEVAPVAVGQDITVQLDATGNAAITTADIDAGSSDNCGVSSLSLSQMGFTCNNVGANTVTLTVTDNNNNISTATVVVTVEDHVAPVATAQDITVELTEDGDVTITADQIDFGSSDACGIASLELDNSSFDCSNVGANTVTLTVTDNNNNVSTTTAVVTVENNLVPVVLTQNLTIQLDEDGNAAILANGSEIDAGSSDTCGIASMSVEPTDFICSDVGEHTVTLTVTNVNGNDNSAPATITVADSIAPELTIPEDAVVECTEDTSSTATGVATGTDMCGAVIITQSDSSVPGPGYTEVITRTWTATDESDNATIGTQTITVVDTTFPELAVPEDVTIECTEDTTSAFTGMATGSDTCGSVTIEESDVSVARCGNSEVITRTWTVIDESDNATIGTQTITVVDTTAPILTIPADTIVECSEDTSSAATGVATGSDTCGSVTITESDESVAGCGNTSVITRTWKVTDACSNETIGTQTITVVDTTAPVLAGVPADATVECDSVPVKASPTASDDCDDNPYIAYVEVRKDGNCPNNYTLTRTWTATDDCGNASRKSQVITVQDLTPPVVIANLVPVPSQKKMKKKGCFTVEFSATDNCDGDLEDHLTAFLNGHPVTNGQIVELKKKKKEKIKRAKGKGKGHDGHSHDGESHDGHGHCRPEVKFEGPSFTLKVTATDDCRNEGTAEVGFVFPSKHDGHSHGGGNDNDDD
jgi:streptogramin lyase